MKPIRDILGSTHVAGRYNFTNKDYLNEGLDTLLELGTRVAKLWLTPRPQKDYPFNSDWPEIRSMVELAETVYYKRALAKPFTTFMFEAFPPGARGDYLSEGFTERDAEFERRAFYSIAKHFLTEYKDTGKTFILQNWESDWLLTNPQFTKEPTELAVKSMIQWINARQDGVNAAREEFGMEGVTVAHAMEVNLVARAMDGKVTATNDVVPHTHCDLYSYSAYDTIINEPDRFVAALDYLNSKSPASALYGEKNVYVGEFGAPEATHDQIGINKRTVEEALEWGALYLVYWELFCNEPSRQYEGRPTNEDCRGFWLVRPDGTRPPVWDYFAGLCR